jgi:hypothetical protein
MVTNWRSLNPPEASVKGTQFPLSLLVSSRGPFVPLKILFSVIKSHGYSMAPSAPMVSQLLFADDSLLLFRENRENAETVKNALDLYILPCFGTTS